MDDGRFEGLVREHRRAVQAYARSMARSETVADEAVQDTFVRAWRYLDSFRGHGSFEGWLIRICRRCIIDLEAGQARHDAAPLQMTAASEQPDHRSETMALIDTLPRPQREVIVVCGLLGYDYDTAATILDVPVGTVRSRLHRARLSLRRALDSGRSQRETA